MILKLKLANVADGQRLPKNRDSTVNQRDHIRMYLPAFPIP